MRERPGCTVLLAAIGIFGLVAAHSAAALAQSGDTTNVLTYQAADREQRLLDGARREGRVVIYSAMIVNQALRPIVDAFGKKYPFVKTTYWRADTENIIAKVAAEVRANNVVGDLVEGTGVGELAATAGLTAAYFVPEIEQYPAVARDPNGLWAPTRFSYFGAAYNTRMVPAGDAPKAYEDLLDPRWKDKMAWRVGTSSGTPLFITNLRLAWGEEKAMAYLQKLKDQRIVNFGSGSARTLVDRVIAGEYPIALQIFAHHPVISAAKGAPVKSILMDPVPTTAATMSVVRGASHPHAAMLLADFILSKEGQEILARAEYFPARPDVPPLTQLSSIVPKTAGVPENFINPDKLLRYTASSEKIYQDLFR